jgi:hypothetical protein
MLVSHVSFVSFLAVDASNEVSTLPCPLPNFLAQYGQEAVVRRKHRAIAPKIWSGGEEAFGLRCRSALAILPFRRHTLLALVARLPNHSAQPTQPLLVSCTIRCRLACKAAESTGTSLTSRVADAELEKQL